MNKKTKNRSWELGEGVKQREERREKGGRKGASTGKKGNLRVDLGGLNILILGVFVKEKWRGRNYKRNN